MGPEKDRRPVSPNTSQVIFVYVYESYFKDYSYYLFSGSRVCRLDFTELFHEFVVFIENINRGAEPKQLAFSGAVGITLGVFPICGILIFQLNCYRKLNILRLDAEMKKGKLIEFISTVTQLLNSSLTVRQNYFSENSVCYIRSAGITKGVRNMSSCIF